MTTIWFQCRDCIHYKSELCELMGHIPLPILLNKFDHRQPYPGDNGARFEPKPGRMSIFEKDWNYPRVPPEAKVALRAKLATVREEPK